MSTTTTPADAEAPRITFELVTLFPEMFDGLLATTVIGKAIAAGTVAVHRTNPRDFGLGNYRQVDDTPYGGGPGMIMRVEPIAAALDAIAAARGPSHRILLTPRGRRFDQAAAQRAGGAPAHHAGVRALRGRRRTRRRPWWTTSSASATSCWRAASWRRRSCWRRPRAWFRACSAAACPRATNRSRPGASSTRSGRARPNGTGQAPPPVLLSGDHAAIARWRRRASAAADAGAAPRPAGGPPADRRGTETAGV